VKVMPVVKALVVREAMPTVEDRSGAKPAAMECGATASKPTATKCRAAASERSAMKGRATATEPTTMKRRATATEAAAVETSGAMAATTAKTTATTTAMPAVTAADLGESVRSVFRGERTTRIDQRKRFCALARCG
jgi:hypothetical protein